jgi:hypothetical protein
MLKKIARSKRGIGTVVGAVIFIAIIMFLLINIVLWTTNSATSMRQLDTQGSNEKISFTDIAFTKRGILLTLQNSGPMTSHLVTLWITNSSPYYYGLYDKTTTPSFDVKLGPQSTNTSEFPVSWTPGTTYKFKVITEDGQLFTSSSTQSSTTPSTQSTLPDLYAHMETRLIKNIQYYELEEYPADNVGLTLTVPITGEGNYTLGNFTYPLWGLQSIPAGTWQATYRAMISVSEWRWHWGWDTSVTYYVDIRVRNVNGTVVKRWNYVSPYTYDVYWGRWWGWQYPFQGYWGTYQGSNSTLSSYTIPSGQYYLEVGYCVGVYGREIGTAYLMIDNQAFAPLNQTDLMTPIT